MMRTFSPRHTGGLQGMSDALRQGLRTTTEGARGLARVFQGFKDFISRGNAIELAVGVVIGAAFGGVITAIQDGLIAPLIAMIFGQPDISDIWVIGAKGEAKINMGLMLNALAERRKRGIEAEPERPSEDILLLQEIRDLLAAQSTPALRSDTGQVPPAGPTGPTGPAAPGAPGRPPVA
jgi:large conductance mechanosensitive channel